MCPPGHSLDSRYPCSKCADVRGDWNRCTITRKRYDQKSRKIFFFFLLKSETSWGSNINRNTPLRRFGLSFCLFSSFFSGLLRKVTKQLQISKNSTLFMTKKRACSLPGICCVWNIDAIFFSVLFCFLLKVRWRLAALSCCRIQGFRGTGEFDV